MVVAGRPPACAGAARPGRRSSGLPARLPGCGRDRAAGRGSHLIGVVDEGREQIEFAGGELDLLARRRTEFPARKIEGPAGKPCLRSGQRLLLRGSGWGPTQHALDPSQELAREERLWQVVVRAHFEANDALDRLAASAQDDDPDIRLFPHRAGECQSVFTGQYQVEDHKIDWGLRHDPSHPGTVLRGRNPVVALARQIFLDQGTNLWLIIDDQDVTFVQLRLLHIMVRPRRQIDGQLRGWVCQAPYHIWLQIVTQNRLPRNPASYR